MTKAPQARLTPTERAALDQRVFWCGTRRELHALEREIAEAYAATTEERAANDGELGWLRNAVRARRQAVARG